MRGLTMVGDAGIGRETWDAYRALPARGEFPIRVLRTVVAGETVYAAPEGAGR